MSTTPQLLIQVGLPATHSLAVDLERQLRSIALTLGIEIRLQFQAGLASDSPAGIRLASPALLTVDGVAANDVLGDVHDGIDEGGRSLPQMWQLEAVLLRAIEPHGILFLCVANSARSQLAEGVARSLLPSSIQVWSAGSMPTRVRPEAIEVMREIGIDISAHHSKHVQTLDPTRVDTVITLCGEEECPVFLGKALRLHWGLPDPAAAEGGVEARLDAFRQVRDELVRRISALRPVSPNR